MNVDELKPKWDLIESLPRQGDYDHVRITAECHADISLGISPDSHRCLILILPADYAFEFHAIEREKLSLAKVSLKNYVVLTLLDLDFCDLFDDLIVSMYNFIRDIADVDMYSEIFIKTFHKWSRFFDLDDGERLHRNVIQGMFGEMIYLRKLLREFPASKVNEALGAWRGPYDQGHDFILEDRNVEVKTRVVVNSSVRITSEDQLDQLEGKGLELAVVVVDPEGSPALTLRELAREIVDVVERSLGDTAIFYATMKQKNLGLGNIAEYDDISFRPSEITRYDCLGPQFPKIVRSALPDALFGFKYSLNTTRLDDHIIDCEEL